MTEQTSKKHVVRVYPEDGTLINHLAGPGETQADVVRSLLAGEVPEEQIAAARTLAQRENRGQEA